MDKDDILKFMLEQSLALHKLFLEWRNKLLVCQIVIIYGIGYFLLTCFENPENKNHYNKIERGKL